MIRRIAIGSTAAGILIGLWFALRPPELAPPAIATPAPRAPAAKSFELVVRDGKLVSGSALLQVRQGEQVKLRIESNAADELHLHGYDLGGRIEAGAPFMLEFTASRSGRFELELHKGHTKLAALEVYPR